MLPSTHSGMTTRWLRTGALLALAIPFAAAQGPDPNGPAPEETADNRPGRGVARISVVAGDVSVRRGDSGDWVAAAPNAPLVVQDTLHAGVNARAEVQMDRSNIIRLAPDSEIRFAELEYQRYGIQIASGTVMYRVLRELDADVEVSAPIVSVRPTRKAAFRITVRPDGSTEVTVRLGEVEVASSKGTERLQAGRTMLVRGTAGDPEFQLISATRRDEWDQWNESRDKELERSNAYKYVSSSVYGAEDLDQNGRWEYDAPYGNVWVPNVAADWAPYRYGRWSWVDYYGWSWVSYDPWGWAPYHYGRWYHGPRGWCWWPGAIGGRHYWSPGLVAWVGFGGGGFGFGHVGWVPLAPYEPFHPWYGWNYYRGGGRYGGTHIVNNVNITNVYRNARVSNGMTTVAAHDFTAGRSVHNVRLSANEMQQGSLMRGQLPIAPERASQRLAERQMASTPQSAGRSSFFTRRGNSGSPGTVSFDQQQRNVQEMTRRVAGTADPSRSGAGRRSDAGGSSLGPTSRMGDRMTERSASPSGTTERGGWRRFGDPSSTHDGNRIVQSTGRGESSANPGASAAGRESWRRFGDPGSRSSSVTPEMGSRGSQRNSSPEPNARSTFGSGSRRGGDSGATYSQPAPSMRRSDPGSPSYQNRSRSGGESIGVNPSIVRERSQRQPSYSAPAPSYRGSDSGGGRSGGFSAPQRSSPPSGGGSRGGGSAPSGGSRGSGGSSGGSHGGRGR